MTEWLSKGLEGRSLRDTLYVYLFGVVVLAPISALLASLFGIKLLFQITPLLVIFLVIAEYSVCYLSNRQVVPDKLSDKTVHGQRLRKPPPVLRSNWFQSKSELNYLTALIARRSVVPDFPDTSLRKEIDASEQIKVKWESVRKLDNGDVIFMASILGEKGWLDIWTRCGVAVSKGDSLEKLLQAALDEVRKEESEKTQTEGSFVLEAVSQDVVAAYAINPEAISNIRISR